MPVEFKRELKSHGQSDWVVVNMPQGLGRFGVEDASTSDIGFGAGYIPSTKFEWYLKNLQGECSENDLDHFHCRAAGFYAMRLNHLGSTMLVYGTQSTSRPDIFDQGGVQAAYDYRAFGEQVDLEQKGDKVTENFTGKCPQGECCENTLVYFHCRAAGHSALRQERDDETELNYFGARYLDPMLGLWVSVDPKRQFASPYLYAGNGMNPINSFDPDGNETIVNLNGDNTILNMVYNAEGNNLVKFNNADGSSFTANEPPSNSYFYSKNKEGRYKIEGQSFDVNMQANADDMLDQAFDAWPADFGCWRTGGALDFKNAYYEGAVNTVGIVNGTAMTARDAGNAMWGGWVNTMYPMPKPAMNFISDVVAGGKEDASSAVMQNWGYDNYKP